MPKGPSILKLRDNLSPFIGSQVTEAGGYDTDLSWISGQVLQDISTHGKHLLFVFPTGILRVHLMLFGKIFVNERKKVNRSFFLEFPQGEINGYVVRAKTLSLPLESHYDWSIDIMHPAFDKAKAVKKLLRKPNDMIGETLMDQDIFAGVGNRIRNEALFLAGIHPESIIAKTPESRLKKLVEEVVAYSRIFYQDLINSGTNLTRSVYKKENTPDGKPVRIIRSPAKWKLYISEHHQKKYV